MGLDEKGKCDSLSILAKCLAPYRKTRPGLGCNTSFGGKMLCESMAMMNITLDGVGKIMISACVC